MPFRIFGLCTLLLFTAGCSSLPSMDNLFASNSDETGLYDAAAMAAEPMPAPAPPPDDFCTRVAASVHARLAAQGFDAATQDGLAQQYARQCAATR